MFFDEIGESFRTRHVLYIHIQLNCNLVIILIIRWLIWFLSIAKSLQFKNLMYVFFFECDFIGRNSLHSEFCRLVFFCKQCMLLYWVWYNYCSICHTLFLKLIDKFFKRICRYLSVTTVKLGSCPFFQLIDNISIHCEHWRTAKHFKLNWKKQNLVEHTLDRWNNCMTNCISSD